MCKNCVKILEKTVLKFVRFFFNLYLDGKKLTLKMVLPRDFPQLKLTSLYLEKIGFYYFSITPTNTTNY